MQCFDELHTKFCLPLIMFSSSHQSTDNSFETETNILPEQKMKADYNNNNNNNNNNFINLLKKAFQLYLQRQISKT